MSVIKDIPNRLECAYCIRNHTHGGECQNPRFRDNGCLAFLQDPKGCIRTDDLKIPIPLYFDFPLLNTWCDYWQIRGVDTELRVIKIHGIKWDVKKGNLIIYARCDYYINEYHDNYIDTKNVPKLKLIK